MGGLGVPRRRLRVVHLMIAVAIAALASASYPMYRRVAHRLEQARFHSDRETISCYWNLMVIVPTNPDACDPNVLAEIRESNARNSASYLEFMRGHEETAADYRRYAWQPWRSLPPHLARFGDGPYR